MMCRLVGGVCLVGSLLAGGLSAQSMEFETLTVAGGETLEYALVRPEGFDPNAYYPVLFALPPGPQTKEMVEAGLSRYWGEQAAAKGWVVVSPVAPKGATFFEGDGHKILAPLLDHVRTTIRVEGARMHLAGASNGGRSAFKLALEWPFEFCSLLTLPGYVVAEDLGKVGQLSHIGVHMFVGGDDARWLKQGQRTLAALESGGVAVSHTVLEGEGHVPQSLDGGAVVEHLAARRAAAISDGADGARAVSDALDDFHDAACKGDEGRYFGRFAEGAIFLGTDPGERWDVPAFKGYAMKYFQRPSAWIYVPSRRHVSMSPDGQTAWFDEVVTNRSYGDCRGTGMMRLEGETWLLCQYSLSVPIPNDLTRSVVADIRAHAAGALPLEGVTVIAVRHAEKVSGPDAGRDPALSEEGQARAKQLASMLGSLPIRAVVTSPYKRTMHTAKPLCDALGLESISLGAKDYSALRERIATAAPGGVVVVVGHSNTVPELLRFLGLSDAPGLEEKDYDRLFVARLGARPSLLQLRY